MQIQFERGTVSYMLTSTLTRPTTMAPTTSTETKIYLTDSIDIAPIAEPKPRVISLEPISRRTRAKTSRQKPEPVITDGLAPVLPPQTPTGSDFPARPRTGVSNGSPEDHEAPRSPSPSDVSFESRISSGASGTEYGVRSINTAQDGSVSMSGSRSALKNKTITATIHILKGGFLRGDQIPIKVTINHTKHIRSLKGIILTLYRQARVDMHPALPVVPNSKGDKNKTEDYYPKSRTGLGGLSLSSAGSSHVFRKDLSQSFAPLFVDPRTLTADVKCSVRVPDEAFATISNVPGAMISFKYYIEVVVDIQGKLTGLDRMVANAGLVNVPSAGAGTSSIAGEDVHGSMFSTWGGNFVDTDQIRREKGVISSLFEVVVGTKDSERNGKRKQTQIPENIVHEIPYDSTNDTNGAEGYDGDYYGYDENGQYYDYGYDPAYYDAPGYEQYGIGPESTHQAHAQQPMPEQGLSEKEQMRRAEERLLPSQPPASGSSLPPGIVPQGMPPSAPVLPEDEYNDVPYYAAAGSSSSQAPPPPFRSVSSRSTIIRNNTAPTLQRHPINSTNDNIRTTTSGSSTTIHASQHNRPPTTMQNTEDATKPLPPIPLRSPVAAQTSSSSPAPDYFPSSSSHVQPTDDKEELQRRRLEMERSAPPTDSHDDEGGLPHLMPSAPPLNGMQSMSLAPSAPTLDDEDEGLVDAMRAGRAGPSGSSITAERRVSEALPEYRR